MRSQYVEYFMPLCWVGTLQKFLTEVVAVLINHQVIELRQAFLDCEDNKIWWYTGENLLHLYDAVLKTSHLNHLVPHFIHELLIFINLFLTFLCLIFSIICVIRRFRLLRWCLTLFRSFLSLLIRWDISIFSHHRIFIETAIDDFFRYYHYILVLDGAGRGSTPMLSWVLFLMGFCCWLN